jgi:two-component system cell cycle response regulator CpdR
MGQAKPFKPVALVVEDNQMQRDMMVTLLEESEMDVFECESAEAALLLLERLGASLAIIFTDVKLHGPIDGVELAQFAHQHYPKVDLVVTSGMPLTKELPEGAAFMPKPWVPLNILREAERSRIKHSNQ